MAFVADKPPGKFVPDATEVPAAQPTTFQDVAYDNPLLGTAETAAHLLSGIPNLFSQAIFGKDIQYEPRTTSGKLLSGAIDYPFQKLSEAATNASLMRAEGPNSIGGNDPLTLAKTGIAVPTSAETPAQSRAMGAVLDVGLNAAPMLVGMKAKLPQVVKVNPLDKPSGLLDVLKGDVPAIAGNYVRSISGNADTRTQLADALAQRSDIPFYPTSAAERVSGISAGTPIQSLQRTIAGSPAQLPGGGPAVSQAFNQLLSDQAASRQAFLNMRDSVTGGMREHAIAGADASGGPIIAPADEIAHEMMTMPGLRASDVVTKALGSVRNKLASLADSNGQISTEDLYTVRKDMGKYIEDAAGAPGAKYDRKLAAGLQNQLQDAFDTAIEKAGGKGWRTYLDTWSQMTQAEKDALATSENQYKPAQQTNLGGANSSTATAQDEIPHVMTHTFTGANWIAHLLRKRLEPRVQGQLGAWMVNPGSGELAAQLRAGITPQDMMAANERRQALARALASGTIAGALQEQQ